MDNHRILPATAVAVYLRLNIEVIDDRRGAGMLMLPLVSLARLLMALWTARALLIGWRDAIRRGSSYFNLGLDLAGIGWRSMVWGLGWR